MTTALYVNPAIRKSTMINTELLNWCKCKDFNEVEYISALLSTFTPDKEELGSWNITDIGFNKYIINDTRYEILSEDDIIEEIEQYKGNVQDDYIDEVPKPLQEHIDWKSFWKSNPISIQEYTESAGMEKITFNETNYYYIEYECNN